jgi:hypothetical protein
VLEERKQVRVLTRRGVRCREIVIDDVVVRSGVGMDLDTRLSADISAVEVEFE